MSGNWRAVIGILLVFAFGCLSGWLSSSALHDRQTTLMLQSGPEGIITLWENRLTHNLDLDENQKRQIHECFLENLAQHRKLQKQIAPQVVRLNHVTLRRIIALLSPGQAARFSEKVAFFRQHFKQGPFNPKPDSLLTPRTTGQPSGVFMNSLENSPASSTTDDVTNTTVGVPMPVPASSQ